MWANLDFLPIIRRMLKAKVLVSISAGTLVYVLISFFGGQNGLWAMRQLEEQREEISINMAGITKINEELTLEYTALRSDMDVVAAYARRLGYVAEGERLVKISGLPTYYTTMYDTGSVMRRSEVSFIPEWVGKATGLLVGCLLLVLLVLRDLSRGVSTWSSSPPSYEAGLRVGGYDSSSGTRSL